MQRSLRKAIKGAKYVGPGVSIGLKQIQEARRAVREMVIPVLLYIYSIGKKMYRLFMFQEEAQSFEF